MTGGPSSLGGRRSTLRTSPEAAGPSSASRPSSEDGAPAATRRGACAGAGWLCAGPGAVAGAVCSSMRRAGSAAGGRSSTAWGSVERERCSSPGGAVCGVGDGPSPPRRPVAAGAWPPTGRGCAGEAGGGGVGPAWGLRTPGVGSRGAGSSPGRAGARSRSGSSSRAAPSPPPPDRSTGVEACSGSVAAGRGSAAAGEPAGCSGPPSDTSRPGAVPASGTGWSPAGGLGSIPNVAISRFTAPERGWSAVSSGVAPTSGPGSGTSGGPVSAASGPGGSGGSGGRRPGRWVGSVVRSTQAPSCGPPDGHRGQPIGAGGLPRSPRPQPASVRPGTRRREDPSMLTDLATVRLEPS